ncbi:hypothetical protein Pcinc_034281 [Petrolisthes cinctipes]|uniref:Uncharacterized protein n=1 Tax=Petrolisthes cinctipes TaxID=88211 RepID=A0AAE1EQN0_PETCI|nr:hypothetical protein Pcinc_034281 [Petrolisthes cinctipes]
MVTNGCVFLPQSRFTSSVGDLSRGLRDEEALSDLNDDQATSSTSCFRGSKLTLKQRHDQEEELVLEDNDEYSSGRPTSPPPSSSAPPTIVSSAVRNDTHLSDLKFVIEDEPCDSGRSPSRRAARSSKASKSKSKAKPKPKAKPTKSPRTGKVKRGQARRNSGGGGCGVAQVEEVVFSLDPEQQVSPSRSSRTPEGNQSALQNNRGNDIPISDRSVDKPANDNSYEDEDDDDDDDDDDGVVIEDMKTGLQTNLNSKKGKGIGGKVRDKFFPSRNLPSKKKMNRTKKVEKYVDSLQLADLNDHGRVTPLFIGEESLSSEDFNKKRKDLLLRKPKNFMEGDEEEITLDPSYMSPKNKIRDIKKSEQKRKGRMGLCTESVEEECELDCPTYVTEEKMTGLMLAGISENGKGSSSTYPPDNVPSTTTMLSPEEYEEYIGDTLQKDYPELTGVSTEPAPTQYQEPAGEDYCSEPQYEYQEQQEQQYQEEPYQDVQYYDPEQVQQEEEFVQQQQQQQYQHQAAALQPTGPLSGSASMNFMDDHSPTGNGNGDFYHQCVAKYPRGPPRKACGSFSLDASMPVSCDTLASRPLKTLCSPSVPVESSSHSHTNSHECISRFASQFRTSCVTSVGVSSSSSGGDGGAGNDSVVTMCINGDSSSDDKAHQTTTNVVVNNSPSASASDSRTSSTSTSERSSMSISSAASSSVSNINKNRSSLFLPTSTTSLPEISVEPPTPQAPKPKDCYDRENKVKYDLLVPGYRSMFLTVPGNEDNYSDRFLPRYSPDDENGEDEQVEEESSSDDDVVHKPKALAFLTGVAENRGLKRYGSSCDIDRLTSRGMEKESTYTYDDDDDDCNGNYDSSNLTSKVGGTGCGAFVAGKLAMFEKVVEEEHQKFVECQEVRKRIYRMPKKSGEYIEKFYSPQVIDSVDARAIERGSSPSFYDDEYADHMATSDTPYGGRSSPPNLTRSRISHSTHYNPSRSPSPNSFRSPPKSPSPVLRSSSPVPKFSIPKSPSPLRARSATPYSPPLSPLPIHKSAPRFQVTSPGHYDNHDSYDYACGGRPLSPDSTRQRSPTPTSTRQRSPTPTSIPPRINLEQENTSLQERTNEALEMLDMSYLDELPWGVDAHPDLPASSPSPARMSQSSGRKTSMGGRRQEEEEEEEEEERYYEERCRSPTPPATTTTTNMARSPPTSPPPSSSTPDPLEDLFEIEDQESMGSTTSIGGRRNKRAAPKRPTTPPDGTTTSSGSGNNNNKIGGFFGRVKKGMEADVDKVKKIKEKVKKSKDEVKKERKDEAKTAGGGGGGGKRQVFQLFKKSSEPSTAEDAPKSPKKDKAAGGKKRLFGRGGKENFLGRAPNIEHHNDPQVARMAGESFDRESFNLDEGEEVL